MVMMPSCAVCRHSEAAWSFGTSAARLTCRRPDSAAPGAPVVPVWVNPMGRCAEFEREPGAEGDAC